MFIVFNTLVAAYIHHQGMFKIQVNIYTYFYPATEFNACNLLCIIYLVNIALNT